MPELPEVETLKRQLQNAIVDKNIIDISVLSKKSFRGNVGSLIGKKIQYVDRKAKVLLIELENSESKILIHLKMTGQLVYVGGDVRIVGGHPTADWVNNLPSLHTRVIFTFQDTSKLFFNDIRMFGWLKLVENATVLEKELANFVGIEPATDQFSLEEFAKRLQKTARAIKVVLMDQKLIAGVGNIYVNDALWDAQVNPAKAAKALTQIEIERLWKSLNEVIAKGIFYGGASESDYVHIDGMGGEYQKHFLIYKKNGQPCKRCGQIIEKCKIAGRGTYWCKNCQK